MKTLTQCTRIWSQVDVHFPYNNQTEAMHYGARLEHGLTCRKNVTDELNDTYDDELNDPEYDFMEELEKAEEDPDNLRKGRAVEIPSKFMPLCLKTDSSHCSSF